MTSPVTLQGLVSGLDYQSIIKALLERQAGPLDQIGKKIEKNNSIKTSLTEIQALLFGVQARALTLSKPSLFQTTKVGSSNESVLSGSGSLIGSTGTYQFSVLKLAKSHQVSSIEGFADATAAVNASAGALTFEFGKGMVNDDSRLADMRGGLGIQRGKIKITDSVGGSSIVDLTGAVTINDVIKGINNSGNANVTALIQGDRLLINDNAGGAGLLKVENYGTTTTATDLGIAGSSGSGTISGTSIQYLTTDSNVFLANGGLGIRTNSTGLDDFSISGPDGVSFNVDLSSSDSTMGSIVTKINSAASAAGSGVTAKLADDGTRIILQGSGAGNFDVNPILGSNAAFDLGLIAYNPDNSTAQHTTQTVGGVKFISGSRILSGINAAQTALLKGGQSSTSSGDIKGIRDGIIQVTAKSGSVFTADATSDFTTDVVNIVGPTTIEVASTEGLAVGNKITILSDDAGTVTPVTRTITDLTGTQVSFDGSLPGFVAPGSKVTAQNDTISSVLNLLNQKASAAGIAVSFQLNDSGNAIVVKDSTGGAGSLTVSDLSGSAASDLNIAATTTGSTIIGGDLQPGYISGNTLLSTLNLGKGVGKGSITIKDKSGIQFSVDLSQSADNTIGKVISEINSAASVAGSSVLARVNDDGNGILVSDSSATTGFLKISDVNSTTAKDLNILGQTDPLGTPVEIDGSFEKQVSIAASSSLNSIRDAINSAGVGVTATVVNTGSTTNPFKLVISSSNAGSRGRMVISSSLPELAFQTNSQAQDSVLLYGSESGGAPVLITGSSNTVSDVVPGLTLSLKSESSAPVTITVEKDLSAAVEQAKGFVDSYNKLVSKIISETRFDAESLAKGTLFGESGVRTIRSTLNRIINTPVAGAAAGANTLRSLGFSVTSDGKLSVNEGTLTSKLTNQFDDVVKFFTAQRKLSLDAKLKDYRRGSGIETAQGEDFQIQLHDGTVLSIDLDGKETTGTLFSKINFATGNDGKLVASIADDGFSILLTDTTSGASNLKVTATNSSFAASELGILGDTSASTIKGGLIALKGSPGFGFVMNDALEGMVGSDGILSRRLQSIDDANTDANKDIKKIEDSLQRLQDRLIKQFTSLEQIIAKSQSTMSRLSALQSSLGSVGGGASALASLLSVRR